MPGSGPKARPASLPSRWRPSAITSKTRAQLWEAQALTKARPISGPAAEAFSTWAREAWTAFARRGDVLPGIREMHARVVRERSGRDPLLAFKTGVGGLMELEFHVQALQMRHAIWEPNTLRALDLLAGAGVIGPDTAAGRRGDYLFLRRCEAVIRRVDNASLSSPPARSRRPAPARHPHGLPTREDFLDRFQAARDAIHVWCSSL